ncbi:hypothetical protein [Streptomyces sp. NPDC048636]|uniref:hypothetical protein n=1 Tax=Streptomyces sp. NPDC048636 TaxID=3155762 RepID=UPI0034427C6A
MFGPVDEVAGMRGVGPDPGEAGVGERRTAEHLAGWFAVAQVSRGGHGHHSVLSGQRKSVSTTPGRLW